MVLTIMGRDPFFLLRIQFAFVISFHIVFVSFAIGLAAWLATIDGARLATCNLMYRRLCRSVATNFPRGRLVVYAT